MKVASILIMLLFLSTTLDGSAHDLPVARTTAAPSPFGPPVMVNDNTAGELSAPIATAVNGNELVAVWQDSRSSTAWSAIYTSRSFDNGTTWARNTRVDDPIFNSSKPMDPAIAVSRDGTILVTWQDNRRNTMDPDIFFAKSYDKGVTFNKNVKVDDSKSSPSSWQGWPSIAVTLGGTIYIAWIDGRTNTLRVRGAYSTDMGVTFSPSKEIVSTGTSGQNGVDLVANGNRIFAAFIDNTAGVNHPYVCSSTNGGSSFTAPTRLDNTGSPGKAQNVVSIAPMPTGGVVATWEDTRNGDFDIYASIVSTDSNIITSNIRVDNDSAYGILAWQKAAAVATDQLGNVYAAWQDLRKRDYPAIRFAILKVGKSQFEASIEVAKPGNFDSQLRPSIVVGDPGRVFVAWLNDLDVGTTDFYVSAGYFTNLYDIALSAGWNFVSLFVVNSTYKASTLGLMNGSMVSQWNSSRGAYDKQYVVGISPSLLDFTIKQSTGYWIWVGASKILSLNGTVPTSKQTRTIAGPADDGYWVTVGFVAFNSTRRASDIPAMYNVTGGVTAVAAYNPVTGKYSTYVVGLPPTDFKVVPGQAYWLWCVSSGVLTYYP